MVNCMRVCDVKKKWSMIKYDLSYGVSNQYGVYLLLIIVTLISCNGFYHYGEQLVKYKYTQERPGGYDLYLNLFQGVEPFKPFSGMRYIVPIYWMTVGFLIVYSVSSFAHDDFQGSGELRILYAGGRKAWIIGKTVWVVLQVLMDFLVIWFGILLYSFFQDIPLRGYLSEGVWTNTFPGLIYHDTESYIVVTLLLPILGFLAIACLEMLISVLTNPAIAMAFGCSVLVISSFSGKIWLLGNHAMWMRFSDFARSGIDRISALIVDLVVITGSLYFFSAVIRKKDLLPERG